MTWNIRQYTDNTAWYFNVGFTAKFIDRWFDRFRRFKYKFEYNLEVNSNNSNIQQLSWKDITLHEQKVWEWLEQSVIGNVEWSVDYQYHEVSNISKQYGVIPIGERVRMVVKFSHPAMAMLWKLRWGESYPG